MSIRRGSRPADNFVMISNDFARDERLSFKARGIALYILSHAEVYECTAASIAKANGCGPDQVYAGLKELQDLGYLTREQHRDATGRGTGGSDYLITDHAPVPPGSERAPEHDTSTFPQVSDGFGESPNGQIPNGKTPSPNKKNKGLEDSTPLISSNEEIISPRARTHTRAGAYAHEGTKPGQGDGQCALDGMPTPASSRPVVPINRKAEETFPEFWSVYPLKKAKGAALAAWVKAVRKADPDVIVAGVGRYVVELQRSGSYTAHPSTWLNQERWTDEPATVGNAARGGADRRGGGHQPYRDIEDQSVFLQPIS